MGNNRNFFRITLDGAQIVSHGERMETAIRFPMIKEKTGYRRGPRYRMTPDTRGLSGSAACAARMIACAIRKRDSAMRTEAESCAQAMAKIDRVSMRESALWARIFAQQIANDDPRLDEVRRQSHELVKQFCSPTA